MSMNPENAENEVRLKLDADRVPLATLVTAAGTLANLVGAVSKSLRKGSVEWTVKLEPGSVVMPVAPQVSDEERPGLVRAVTDGLAQIEESSIRPKHFSDFALVQARALANLSTDEVPVTVARGHRPPTRLTKQAVANVDRMTGEAPPRIGSVEGRLEAVNIHGRRSFAIWERATGAKIECRGAENLSDDELGSALGRRVEARGRIRASRGGEKRRVDVTELRVFPREEELPSADDVRGILAS